MNVTTIGTYNISTTKNGMTFSKSGSFTATGVQLVTLVGTGTPTVNGDNVVPITAGTTTCSFTVPVGIPAVGTLGGAPGSCTPATVNGTYTVGTILTTANSVIIQVNIGTPGAYSITTNTVAGIKFAASGSFSTSGTQALTLNGTGTPAASGNQVFTVTFGTSSCTFTVPISGGAGAAVFIADCFSAVETGVYAAGTALNSTNTVDIDINVATPGTYNIATTATNGMVFSANGTFATAGTTTITLVGSGTPLTAGTFNIPMPGTTSCTFPVTVNGAATINWKFTEGPSTLQGGFDLGSLQVISVPPLTLTSYTFSGSNATLDFTLILADIGGGIMNGETYSTTSTTVNNVALLVNDMSGTVYEANASIAGLTFKATVTSHNTSTKTITGTFSGTVKNGAGVTKTITGGTFTGTYP